MSEFDARRRGASGRLDFIMGAVMAGLSLFLFFWFIPTFAPGEGGPGQIAPSFFPRFSITVVFVCAVVIMATNLASMTTPNGGKARQVVIEISGWCVFAVVLFALLHRMGFVCAGVFAVLSGVALTRYRRNYVLIGILAAGLPILLDYGVWALFTIELP